MTSVAIAPCTISELENAPNMHELMEEYAAESAIEGLPHPSAKAEIYKRIEESGMLATIGAKIDQELIGFVLVLASVIPHYGVNIATTESFFVSKPYRKTGAGIKLLRAAEEHAKQVGSPGLLISAPFGGTLAEVLPRQGYVETNRVFMKRFA